MNFFLEHEENSPLQKKIQNQENPSNLSSKNPAKLIGRAGNYALNVKNTDIIVTRFETGVDEK